MSTGFTLSGYSFGKIDTIRTTSARDRIPPMFYKWADLEVKMSQGYKDGKIPPSSQFQDGRAYIGEVMNALDHVFLCEFTDYNRLYLEDIDFGDREIPDFSKGGFRKYFRQKIENPGFLHRVVSFGIAEDVDTISFYWHAWQRNIAKIMDFEKGLSWDLSGHRQAIRETSYWHYLEFALPYAGTDVF